MATYRKRKNQDGTIGHQFMIRRKGFPALARTFARKTDGEAWVQEVESAMRNGRFRAAPEAQDMTLSQLVELYIKKTFKERRSPHTPRQTLLWWCERLGDVAITNISKRLVKQHWNELTTTTSVRTGKLITNRTLNSYIETLSACFSFAVGEELLESNPIYRIKRKSLDNSREVVLSQEQLAKLLEAAEKSSNRYLPAALLMTLSTGGRRAEVMGLRWDEVNLATGEVQFLRTKNGKKRTVMLGAAALKALADLANLRVLHSPLIFAPLKPRRADGLGKFSFTWEDLRAPFRRACKEADIEGFRWHDLRHCAASYLLMSGATMEEMMKILGHRSSAMSWRYSHLDQRRTTELVGKVDSAFLAPNAA